MNKIIFLLVLLFSTTLLAEVGTVSRVIGTDAFILRDENKLPVHQGMDLDEGDRIETNSSVVLLHLYPGTQVNLSEKSIFVIEEHEVDLEQSQNESSSIFMRFLKGKLKILVEKLRSDDTTSQTIQTKSVALAVRGTQFEVEENTDGTNVDVTEGVVAATTKTDSVDLKKDDSIQINRQGTQRLKDAMRKRAKFINYNWQFPFDDSEKIRQHWRERRGVFKNEFFRLDPQARNKLRDQKRLKREARRKKYLDEKEVLLNNKKEEKIEKLKEIRKRRIR